MYDFLYRAMLDHMMFAHEMEDGSVNTDLNATDSSYKNSSFSNSIDDDMHEDFEETEENGDINNRATASVEMSDNGSVDDMPIMANMEVVFETSDENVVMVETVACNKPDSEENNGETMTKTTPRKSSKKNRYEYDEGMLVGAEQMTSAELATVKNNEVSTFPIHICPYHVDEPKTSLNNISEMFLYLSSNTIFFNYRKPPLNRRENVQCSSAMTVGIFLPTKETWTLTRSFTSNGVRCTTVHSAFST